MARRKKGENLKQDLVRICIQPSDASQDRFLPRAEAKTLYEAGELARDIDSNCEYCLPSKYYNPLKNRFAQVPYFLRKAKRVSY